MGELKPRRRDVVGWTSAAHIRGLKPPAEHGHKKYLHYFRRALAAYDRADQLRREDASGKWAAKVGRYKELIAQNDPAYAPDTKCDGLIEILFPEISAPF